jgi:opacity protein-like surface antigen
MRNFRKSCNPAIRVTVFCLNKRALVAPHNKKENISMKQITLLSLAISALIGSSAFAGPPDYEKAPAPQPEIFGTGLYMAIDMGANVYQDRGGDRVFRNEFGDTLTIDPKNDVGFFGGVKAGWVFGTGIVRPAIEADLFYNGFRGGADSTLVVNGALVRSSSTTSFINTGAFMSNAILKFAFGRFQPYVGAGVGVYYAESAGVDVSSPRGTFGTSGGSSHADFAWQIIAGADYYWNPKFSTFIEYRFLDYTSTQIDTSQSRNLGQQLIGAGVRFHF